MHFYIGIIITNQANGESNFHILISLEMKAYPIWKLKDILLLL